LCLIVISWLIVGLLFSYVALSPSFLRRLLSPQLPSLSHRRCCRSLHCHHHYIATVPTAFVAVLPHCHCPATLLLSCHQVDCCIAVISSPSCCRHSRHHRRVVILFYFSSLLLFCCRFCCLAVAVPTMASSQLPPHLVCFVAVVSSLSRHHSCHRIVVAAVTIAFTIVLLLSPLIHLHSHHVDSALRCFAFTLLPQSPSPSRRCCLVVTAAVDVASSFLHHQIVVGVIVVVSHHPCRCRPPVAVGSCVVVGRCVVVSHCVIVGRRVTCCRCL